MPDELEGVSDAPSPSTEESSRPEGEVSHPAVVRSLIPIIFLGFVVAFVALFLLQWPLPPGSERNTDILLKRLSVQSNGDISINLARTFLDIGIFLITLVGIGFMVAAWRRGDHGPLIGMIAVGILGIAYASGMAMFNGPMVSICGFTLILFGGLVAWLASSSKESSDDTDAPIQTTGTPEIRTNDHASHSVA